MCCAQVEIQKEKHWKTKLEELKIYKEIQCQQLEESTLTHSQRKTHSGKCHICMGYFWENNKMQDSLFQK